MSGALPVDRLSLAYAALATLATFFRWPSEGRGLGVVLLVHAVTACAALLAPSARRGGPVARFLGGQPADCRAQPSRSWGRFARGNMAAPSAGAWRANFGGAS